METLKQLLKQDFSGKTKAELVGVIKDVKSVIGSDYNDLVGLADHELPKLKKEELLNVVSMIHDGYTAEWEDDFKTLGGSLKSIVGQLKSAGSFTAAGADTADFAAELGSLEFDKLIGGPLNACVTAQSNASVCTVNFVKEVGFETIDGQKKLIMVDFSYKRDAPNPAFDPTKTVDPATNPKTIVEEVLLKVPFISLLTVPSLRIENCTIDFNVKLNSVYTKNVSDKIGINATVGGQFGPIKFNVSASYQRSSSTGVKVEKEYTMGVKVVATNDEMPAGLEKVLNILAG